MNMLAFFAAILFVAVASAGSVATADAGEATKRGMGPLNSVKVSVNENDRPNTLQIPNHFWKEYAHRRRFQDRPKRSAEEITAEVLEDNQDDLTVEDNAEDSDDSADYNDSDDDDDDDLFENKRGVPLVHSKFRNDDNGETVVQIPMSYWRSLAVRGRQKRSTDNVIDHVIKKRGVLRIGISGRSEERDDGSVSVTIPKAMWDAIMRRQLAKQRTGK